MINEKGNTEITKEDRMNFATRFLEIEDEDVRQGIIWLTNIMDQKKDDSFYIPKALLTAYETECDPNKSDPKRNGGYNNLVKDFKTARVLLAGVAGSLDDEYRKLLFSYMREKTLSKQGYTSKDNKPYVCYRAKKIFFSAEGNGMRAELSGFFDDYRKQNPLLEELKRQNDGRN